MTPSEAKDIIDRDPYAPSFTPEQHEWVAKTLQETYPDYEIEDAGERGHDAGWEECCESFGDAFKEHFSPKQIEGFLEIYEAISLDSDADRARLASLLHDFITQGLAR